MTSSIPSSSAQAPEGEDPPPRSSERHAPPAELPAALGDALALASASTMRELVTAAQSAHHDADLRDSVAWVADAVRVAAVDPDAEPRTHPVG